MSTTVFLLALLESLSHELFFVVSLIGFLVVGGVIVLRRILEILPFDAAGIAREVLTGVL